MSRTLCHPLLRQWRQVHAFVAWWCWRLTGCKYMSLLQQHAHSASTPQPPPKRRRTKEREESLVHSLPMTLIVRVQNTFFLHHEKNVCMHLWHRAMDSACDFFCRKINRTFCLLLIVKMAACICGIQQQTHYLWHLFSYMSETCCLSFFVRMTANVCGMQKRKPTTHDFFCCTCWKKLDWLSTVKISACVCITVKLELSACIC